EAERLGHGRQGMKRVGHLWERRAGRRLAGHPGTGQTGLEGGRTMRYVSALAVFLMVAGGATARPQCAVCGSGYGYGSGSGSPYFYIPSWPYSFGQPYAYGSPSYYSSAWPRAFQPGSGPEPSWSPDSAAVDRAAGPPGHTHVGGGGRSAQRTPL